MPDPICTRCGAVCRERYVELITLGDLTWHRKLTLCEHCKPGFDGYLRELAPEVTEPAPPTPGPTTYLHSAAQP